MRSPCLPTQIENFTSLPVCSMSEVTKKPIAWVKNFALRQVQMHAEYSSTESHQQNGSKKKSAN